MSDDPPKDDPASIDSAAELIRLIVVGSIRLATERMQQLLVAMRAEGITFEDDKLTATALFALAMSALYRAKPTLTDEEARTLFTSLWEMRTAQRGLWYEGLARSNKPKGDA